jgi:uncharacterized membrane protein YfcA
MQYVLNASHAVAAISPATITLAVTFLSIFFGSLAAGLAGFAFSAIAGAMLFHRLAPIEAVPLLLACSITTQLLSITKLWGTMQWRLCIPYLIGGIAGITGGATAMPGAIPTIWCNLKGLSKIQQRAIVQPFILLMQIATMAYFSKLGILASATWTTYVWCAPAVVAGTFLGLWLFERVDDGKFRRLVLLFLLISGGTMIL